MKQCLADVNVLLPLFVVHHEHHLMAMRWFEGLQAEQCGLCRVVQLALIRLMGNPAVMGDYAISASAAWGMLEDLMEDERFQFVAEPATLEQVFPKLLKYPVPTGKLVGDAYLAAFSIAAKMQLTTIDKGFRQFKEVDLALLAS